MIPESQLFEFMKTTPLTISWLRCWYTEHRLSHRIGDRNHSDTPIQRTYSSQFIVL